MGERVVLCPYQYLFRTILVVPLGKHGHFHTLPSRRDERDARRTKYAGLLLPLTRCYRERYSHQAHFRPHGTWCAETLFEGLAVYSNL